MIMCRIFDLSNYKSTRWHSKIVSTSLQNIFQIHWRFTSATKSLIIWKIYMRQQDNGPHGASTKWVRIPQALLPPIRDRNPVRSQYFVPLTWTSERSPPQRNRTVRRIWMYSMRNNWQQYIATNAANLAISHAIAAKRNQPKRPKHHKNSNPKQKHTIGQKMY